MDIPKDKLEEVKEASFNTFAKYFDNDKKKYLASLKKLSEEDLEEFLLLERFYNFYCLHPSLNPAPGRDFVSGRVPGQDFKLIIIFSLIEALMSEVPWKPFEEWLSEKGYPIEIKNKEDLERLKEEYYEMYGSGKKARKFFNDYVEQSDKESLLNKFIISAKTQGYQQTNVSLDELIKILYDVRSKFVHDAKFIRIFIWLELVASGFETNRHHIISTLDVELMQGIFEKGLLRYFGLLSKM